MAKIKAKRARVNMRVPEDLLVWAKEHALSKNTTLTQLFIDHLTEEKEKANVQSA